VTAVLSDALLDGLSAAASADGVQQTVVGAVIRAGNTVLLLRRPRTDFMGGIWELPSGKTEPGETLKAALIREVAEETGLRVTTITAYLGHFDYQSGSGKHSRQFSFSVDIADTAPVTLAEHDAFDWADLSSEMPVTDEVSEILTALR
jgi:8-oxo-dGTP diphosphatase